MSDYVLQENAPTLLERDSATLVQIPSEDATEKERAQWNAQAWLALTDRELIERSASLDLPGNLHPEVGVEGGQLATRGQLVQLRKNADAVARDLAGAAFVKRWIADNRDE